MAAEPLKVTAITASAQLGGTERVLLDFAARAFEHDIALRVLTPRDGPLIAILNQLGVPAEVVPGPDAMLRGSQQPSRLASLVPALLALPRWARDLSRHRFWADAQVLYTVAFKAHTAALLHHDRTTVWHLHEFPPAMTGGVWKMLARRSPNGLIANSEAVANAWGKRETGNGKRAATFPFSPFPFPAIQIVPNGVDLDRFKPREPTGWIHERLGIPRSHRLIGMPAVFARWKGHELVMQAFNTVAAEFPDAHLVFVGGSIYDTVAEREFGAWLERSVREPLVHILPFQPDIERAYPEFDLTTHYSMRPEPFGRVILESMACGVPVIAAAEGGPLEIMGAGSREHETPEGWLVVPREATALAATLRRALSAGPERLTAKGRAGRARADERFSAREFARNVAQAIRAAYAGSTV